MPIRRLLDNSKWLCIVEEMGKKIKIAIIGGGFAGIKTALELGNNPFFEILLITPRNRFEYHGAMYRSATGKSPLEVVVPLQEIFSQYTNITVAFDTAVDIIPDKTQVKGESGEYYHYDKLVISIGNVVNYFNIPGMAENAETLYDITKTIQLRHRLVDVLTKSPADMTLNISIIGAGPTGVEVAADILSFAKAVANRYNLHEPKISTRLIEAAPRILSRLRPDASLVAENRLKAIGVDVITDVKVLEATPSTIITNKGTYDSDVTIWTAGTRTHPFIEQFQNIFTLDERRKVVVNEYFQSNDPHIYVIGDAAATPYSGMAQTAIHNAIWLADNFKRTSRDEPQKAYAPKVPEYTVPIGDGWAILQTAAGIISGGEGWNARRQADHWVLENFLPYAIADKHLQYGEQLARPFREVETPGAKLLQTLENHISGEVSVEAEDIDYYSTDGSIFEITPSAIVFPKDSVDVQELVMAVNELRREGIKTSLTARGNGTDQGGGPIGDGVIVDFTRHMNQILEVGQDYVVVQPGCMYERLQNRLNQHSQYLPPYPASIGVCTIGGAVANNSAGEKSVKYGSTREYVEALQVVLADGTATWIYPMDEHQLNEKKQLQTLEGDVYRQIDELLTQNATTIHNDHPNVTKESSGYALWKIKNDTLFNLPQVIVGSQGTLALITSIRLRTLPLPDPNKVTLLVSFYDNINSVCTAASHIHKLGPSALEIVDENLLSLVTEQAPALLAGLLPNGSLPEFVLLAEFDDADDNERHTKEKEASDIFLRYATSSVVKYDPVEKASYWKLRRSAAAVMWTIPGKLKALPIIEDGAVPPDQLNRFLTEAYKIFNKYELTIAVWGHAGDANLHMQPFMNLSDDADREKIFSLTNDYYTMIQSLGGTAAGEHNDSLMRAPYRHLMFGQAMEDLFDKTKNIFDSNNIFNPKKKVGVDLDYIKGHVRHEYSIKSLDKLNKREAKSKIDN